MIELKLRDRVGNFFYLDFAQNDYIQFNFFKCKQISFAYKLNHAQAHCLLLAKIEMYAGQLDSNYWKWVKSFTIAQHLYI